MTLKQLLILIFSLISVAATAQNYNNIEFIENKGQWDERIQYKGDISNGNFFIRKGGFTVVQHNPVDFGMLSRFLHGQNAEGKSVKPTDKITLRSHAWHVDFIDALPDIKIVPDKIIPTYNNYFHGNDPSKWASHCNIYQALTFKEVYPNIDVRYYTSNGFLKYDIIVKPGGDVSKIALRYDGVDKLQVKNKELVISTSVGDLRESAPVVYQSSEKGTSDVSAKYSVKGNVVRFEIKDYDPTQTLVIDPVVIFGSFSGSTMDNWGFTATYGPDGAMYGGGVVFEGTGSFPASPGAYQTSFQGGVPGTYVGFDMAIIKLNSSGANRVYATYMGGGGNEQPHSLIVDPQGNLIIAGRSNSGNYPTTAPNGQIGAGGGWDIVVTKLNAAGTALIGSKKIGGTGNDGVNISDSRAPDRLQRNYGDDGRSEVALDGAGNIYVASSSQSSGAAATAFPTTPGSFQPSFGGGFQDAVIIKFNPTLSTLLFASYFGGSAEDAGYVLSLSPSGEIYMAGGTLSGNLPGPTAGTLGSATHGNVDGYLTRIANNGSAVLGTTYIGTPDIDQVFGVQFDRSGFPYVMGQTTGQWPIVNAAYGVAGGKQFICKVRPDLSAYVYSTAFGTGAATPNISPIAFLVDRCENVYMSGWGGYFFNDNDFNSAGTAGLPVTPNALKSTTDGKDLYFFVLKKDATSQLFGSFYGETNTNGGCDHVDGGTSRFDSEGVIYQAMCGNCKLGGVAPNPVPDLVTAGAWSTVNTSSNCVLTMIKIDMDLAGVNGQIQSTINGVRDTAGCVPLSVTFSDSVGTAQSYEWHFNYVPGSPPDQITTTPNATTTYNSVGSYPVMLVAIDPNTCNIRDSSFLTIRVGNLESNLDFTFRKLAPCQSFNYEFTNTSFAPNGPAFGPTSFVWDFGDGTPLVTTSGFAPTPITHSFAGPGTYNVKLKIIDDRYCDAPDSIVKPVSVESLVKAIFTTPATGCLPYYAEFDNNSTGGQTWLWEFGDNTTSTAFEPVHLYSTAGTYRVRLIASNPNTCNLVDTSAYFTITVYDSPTPDFSFSPDPPLNNTPTTFTNLSSPDAVRFKWVFGDGDSLITTSRSPVTHQYNSTGTFEACLTAYNQIGCDSTICREVKTLIVPVVDVPTAFTPNSGDINSKVFVKGFGIAKMEFIIWNRWGQKVFEANNPSQGWDGKLKGVVQPMDVYAYTLFVEFSDGTKTTKKGDITLIR